MRGKSEPQRHAQEPSFGKREAKLEKQGRRGGKHQRLKKGKEGWERYLGKAYSKMTTVLRSISQVGAKSPQ